MEFPGENNSINIKNDSNLSLHINELYDFLDNEYIDTNSEIILYCKSKDIKKAITISIIINKYLNNNYLANEIIKNKHNKIDFKLLNKLNITLKKRKNPTK